MQHPHRRGHRLQALSRSPGESGDKTVCLRSPMAKAMGSMSLFQQPPNTLVLFLCDLPIGEPSLECLHRAVGAAARAACRAYRPDEQRDQSAPEEHGEAEPEHAPGPADSPGPAGSPEADPAAL